MLNGKTLRSAGRAGYPDRSRRIFDPQLDISNRGYVRTGSRHHVYGHVRARADNDGHILHILIAGVDPLSADVRRTTARNRDNQFIRGQAEPRGSRIGHCWYRRPGSRSVWPRCSTDRDQRNAKEAWAAAAPCMENAHREIENYSSRHADDDGSLDGEIYARHFRPERDGHGYRAERPQRRRP